MPPISDPMHMIDVLNAPGTSLAAISNRLRLEGEEAGSLPASRVVLKWFYVKNYQRRNKHITLEQCFPTIFGSRHPYYVL